MFIQNKSTVGDLYLSFGTQCAASRGITVEMNGGAYEISNVNPFYGEIYGIGWGATPIDVTEW